MKSNKAAEVVESKIKNKSLSLSTASFEAVRLIISIANSLSCCRIEPFLLDITFIALSSSHNLGTLAFI